MSKYTIRATYTLKKELLVEVDGDPMDPRNWRGIEDEHDVDCSLWDVDSAEPAEED